MATAAMSITEMAIRGITTMLNRKQMQNRIAKRRSHISGGIAKAKFTLNEMFVVPVVAMPVCSMHEPLAVLRCTAWHAGARRMDEKQSKAEVFGCGRGALDMRIYIYIYI